MHRSSIAGLAGLVLMSAAAQAQDVPGTYQLTVAAAAPCALTLSEDGAASLAADCKEIKPAAHWHKSGALVRLTAEDDSAVALLKPTRDGFVGRTIPEGLALVATH